MKRFLLLLVLALLASCGGPRHDPIPRGATVLVLGDSVSYGTGADDGEDYPSVLGRLTGWKVINAGIPGDTSSGGLQRLPDLLEEHAPKLVLVELGGNDFLRRMPSGQTTSNLTTILAQIKARNIAAVLVAVPQPNLFGAALRSLSDDPIYADVAEQTGTPLVENVLSEVLSKNELKSDPIHPNADGYRKVAEGLAEALSELGYLQ